MDDLWADAWWERLASMPRAPTPPALTAQKRVATTSSTPLLFCAEKMPATPPWPPTGYQWTTSSAGLDPLAPPPMPNTDRSPIPAAPCQAAVVGLPTTVPRSSRHARPCRLSELEKLNGRIDKLEATLAELRDLIEGQKDGARVRRAKRAGNGPCVNITTVEANPDGHSSVSIPFSDQATMQNISLDDILRQL